MATGEREDLSFVRPSGWQNHEYAFLEETYQSSWLYNRCHLIAWQLTGQNANPENLLTGTQYLNHKGMLPYEKQVMQYLYDTGGHVLYRVTPVYRDDQLVAQGVLLEARSVEDEGRGLCFCVYCFNVEPGVVIHYRTGDNYADSAPAKVH